MECFVTENVPEIAAVTKGKDHEVHRPSGSTPESDFRADLKSQEFSLTVIESRIEARMN